MLGARMTYARPQEHTRENMHARTKLARAENVCRRLSCSQDLGARYRSKFEPGDEPEKPVLVRGNRL